MTSQQRTTIAHIEAQHETERFIADQAARELAQMDERSVLIAIQVKLAEGRIEEARAIAAAWKTGRL